MFRSISSWIPRDREAGARRVARPRKQAFHSGLETLEGRKLLSTAGLAASQSPVLADFGTQFVQEGNSLALQARATDPNGQTLTYSLDPGAPAGASINPSSGLFTWTPPNVQQTYSISIRANENGGPGLSDARTLNVMVFDVAPNVQAGVNASADQGLAFSRSGSFSDPNPDTWTATVDYGDGTGVQPLTLNADKTFQLDHTYATTGNHAVSVTINDSQGYQGRGFFAIQVNAPTNPSQLTTHPSTSQPTAGTAQAQSSGNGPGATTNLAGSKTTTAIHGQKGPIKKAAQHVKLHVAHPRRPH